MITVIERVLYFGAGFLVGLIIVKVSESYTK